MRQPSGFSASDGVTDLEKLAAAAVLSTVLALTVRKQSPELALLVALAAGTVLHSTALQYLAVIADFWRELASVSDTTEAVSGPLFRATGICVVIHFAASLCRDNGEGSLAAKLELCGNAACIILLLPLLSDMIRLIVRML